MEQQIEKKTWEFRKSEVAEKIKTLVQDNHYLDFVDEHNKNQQSDIFHLDKNVVKHALIKICDIWNKDEKSRNFLKHLIDAYINITPLDKISVFPQEIYDISKSYSCFIIDRARIGVANNEEEKQIVIKEYQAKLNALPKEIRLARFAYCSDKTNKYLSPEAYTAL